MASPGTTGEGQQRVRQRASGIDAVIHLGQPPLCRRADFDGAQGALQQQQPRTVAGDGIVGEFSQQQLAADGGRDVDRGAFDKPRLGRREVWLALAAHRDERTPRATAGGEQQAQFVLDPAPREDVTVARARIQPPPGRRAEDAHPHVAAHQVVDREHILTARLDLRQPMRPLRRHALVVVAASRQRDRRVDGQHAPPVERHRLA